MAVAIGLHCHYILLEVEEGSQVQAFSGVSGKPLGMNWLFVALTETYVF